MIQISFIIIQYIQKQAFMNIDRSLKGLLIGSLIFGSALFGYFRYRKYRTAVSKIKEEENSQLDQSSVLLKSEFGTQTSKLNINMEKQLYRQTVSDPDKMQLLRMKYADYKINNLKYEIIFNLNKGLSYQASVKILFNGSLNSQNLQIDFNGDEIQYVQVNDHVINEKQLIYKMHKIVIPAKYLKKQNSIEIIFTNKYSFFDDGLSTYFRVQGNKYSLKTQCIYATTDQLNINKIIPIIYINQQCTIKLRIIHPDNFVAFSNSEKILIKQCTQQYWKQYIFFIKQNLNRTEAPLNHIRYSARTVKTTVKNYTKFRQIKLQNISQFFIACLPAVEIKCPNNIKSNIRFYCLRQYYQNAKNFVTQIYNQIQSFEEHIYPYNNNIYNRHINVLFIKSDKIDGWFTKGIITLKQSHLSSLLKPKSIYLILRALMGMNKYRSNLNQIIQLNEKTIKIFPQIQGFILLQNLRYQPLKKLKVKNGYFPYFIKIFSKQVKYLCQINENNQIKIWINKLKKQKSEEYWQYFISNIEFVDPFIKNLIIRLSLHFKALPQNNSLIQNLKPHLLNNKYLVYFLKDNQIQDNLSILTQISQKNLQERLPKIPQINAFYENLLNQNLNRYVNYWQNREEAVQLYQKFVDFDEQKNFHHISVLEKELKRIRSFLQANGKFKQTKLKKKLSLIASKTLRLIGVRNELPEQINNLIELHQNLYKMYQQDALKQK